jgi:undecaprenyl-diphosphatase
MMEAIEAWDKALLLELHLAGQEPWDTLMYYATKTWVWIPLFGWWVYLLYRVHGRRFIRWVAFTLLAVSLTDVFCGQGLKPLVGRRRPSQEPGLRSSLHLVRGYTGGLYGFPSNHAANSAALAFSVGLALRRRDVTLIAIGWVLLHSYTRLYLGVHYPSDIVVGWLIGIGLTGGLYLLAKWRSAL